MSSGKLRVIAGPMFSGKTTQLVHDVDRYWRAGKRCIIVKHASDERFDKGARIITHDGRQCEKIPTIIAATLDDEEFREVARAAEVIGIDEVQFYARDDAAITRATTFIESLLLAGKIVICAGLDTDYLRKPFMFTLILASRASEVAKLLAVCQKCGADAPFTARACDEKAYAQTEVGGHDMYAAVCLACHAKISGAH
jgi:thymidine kinase